MSLLPNRKGRMQRLRHARMRKHQSMGHCIAVLIETEIDIRPISWRVECVTNVIDRSRNHEGSGASATAARERPQGQDALTAAASAPRTSINSTLEKTISRDVATTASDGPQ